MREHSRGENRLHSPFHKLVTGNISIQIVLSILAAITYALLSYFWDADKARILTSCIFVPLYLMMLYSFYWGVAERERNMVLYGHMREDNKRGFRAGVIAALPIGIYALITTVCVYLKTGDNIIGVFRICAAPFLAFVEPVITYAPFALVLVAIFSPLAAMCGYHNGYTLYRMWDHILYKNGVRPRKDSKSKKQNTTRRR